MSRGRGGKLGRTREIETFLLFPRGKVFMPSILFRPKHAHFSLINETLTPPRQKYNEHFRTNEDFSI